MREFDFTKRELFEDTKGYESLTEGTPRYFAQLAVDWHGSAVRDNSLSELVAIGTELEERHAA